MSLTFVETAIQYIDAALGSVDGIKALLVDADTRDTLSVIYSQSDLLRHEVVLVELLSNLKRKPMKFMRCVVITRPTSQAIGELSSELTTPNFADYSVFFTNMVDVEQLQIMCNADKEDLVHHVEEIFLDAFPVAAETCIVPIGARLQGAKGVSRVLVPLSQWEIEHVQRIVSGLCSIMMATRRRPCIRYRNNNTLAARIAAELGGRMRSIATAFPDLKQRDSVLLIADRADDPITPLLTQWTYHAMLHEILGITEGNLVRIEGSASGTPSQPGTDIEVLSAEHDTFFRSHQYSNFGDLCVAVRELVESYKALNNVDMKMASLEDIKSFVARVPEARQQSTIMTRHTMLVGAIGDAVRSRNLTDLSVIEQDLLMSNAHSDHSEAVLQSVANPSTDIDDALRLALIYALRYEGRSDSVLDRIRSELRSRGCSEAKMSLIDRLYAYAGAARRIGDALKPSEEGSFLKTMVSAIGGFQDGTKNVLTQHNPWLLRLLQRLYNNSLSTTDYPYQGTEPQQPVYGRDVIVFMLGGATFEEAALVHKVCSGAVDNKTESSGVNLVPKGLVEMMRFGNNSDTPSPGNATESGAAAPPPPTAKLEAKVTLVSTTMLNSQEFLNCVAAL